MSGHLVTLHKYYGTLCQAETTYSMYTIALFLFK